MAISITNQKVAGFIPLWSEFRGFSLLFDNPSDSLSLRGDGAAQVDCNVERDAELGLYKALADGLAQLGSSELLNNYLFCPLPVPSYHVTVWDGINDANVAYVVPERRQRCGELLQKLPHSLPELAAFQEIAESPLLTTKDWGIRLKVKQIENWIGVSICAKLVPADDHSAESFNHLAACRNQLSEVFEQAFGVRPSSQFVPHITLGYFANQSIAYKIDHLLGRWNALHHEIAAELTLTFNTISLYGFTDMATFIKMAH